MIKKFLKEKFTFILPSLLPFLFSFLVSCSQNYDFLPPLVMPASENSKNAEKNETCDEDEDDCEVTYDEMALLTKPKKWTLMVYMAADNNLESEAIADFNEMESAGLDESVTLLVLFDRSDGYDSSNGDWTDTRLYKVEKDLETNRTAIVSSRLSCQELSLDQNTNLELDMANPSVLEGFLEYARRMHTAENYGLIIWGHGSGWRGERHEYDSQARAVAIDDYSSSYMSSSQLSQAIKNGMGQDRLSVIGFDTCFGICIEQAYELSEAATYMAGTPALVPEGGWNYKKVLNTFLAGERSPESLVDSISECYRDSYENYAYASFTVLKLQEIPRLIQSFSDYSKRLADSIENCQQKDSVFEVFEKKAVSYCALSYPTDYYVDLLSLLNCLDAFLPSEEIRASLSMSLYSSWSASQADCSMGVFFCVYASAAMIQPYHPAMYTNGSRDPLLSAFVQDCSGYVPSLFNTGSLLDKLFYTSY